jgi:sugar lactone lactonase YvrE
MRADLAWDCRCVLGEGTVWNAADQSLYFVDIVGRAVLAITPATGHQRRWTVPQRVGWLVPRRGGGWLAGFEQGVVALGLEPEGQIAVDWLHLLHGAGSSMRLNDAKADAHGRLWFGSMNHHQETLAQGCLYRWQAGGVPTVVDAGYCVTNGPAISPDGTRLYHTDSVPRTVHVFDLSRDGQLTNKRVWLQLAPDEGHPDGMNCDAAGNLWIAHWGGSRVTQRDPEGRVMQRIDVPAAQVSNVAFGGPALNDLYNSTARRGLDAAALARTPLAGGLFVVPGAGQGMPAHAFAG